RNAASNSGAAVIVHRAYGHRAKIERVHTERETLRGRLLVATAHLAEPNFDRAVVLILEHGDDGALGIILNRPSEIAVGDVLPEWQGFAPAPAVAFTRGGASPDAGV